jgi:hypothetical protein
VQVIAVVLTLLASALLCSNAARTRAIGFLASMAGCTLWFAWAIGYGYFGFMFQQIALGMLSLCGLLSNLGTDMRRYVSIILMLIVALGLGIPASIAYGVVSLSLWVWAALDGAYEWASNKVLEWKTRE